MFTFPTKTFWVASKKIAEGKLSDTCLEPGVSEVILICYYNAAKDHQMDAVIEFVDGVPGVGERSAVFRLFDDSWAALHELSMEGFTKVLADLDSRVTKVNPIAESIIAGLESIGFKEG
jgi:hypothetical protein